MYAKNLSAGVIALSMLASTLHGGFAVADEENIERRSEASIDRSWNREWRNFCTFFVEVKDTYYCFPNYDSTHSTSSRLNIDELVRESAYELTYHSRTRGDLSLHIVRPAEDVESLNNLLRTPQTNDYGQIHSGQIKEIVGRDELILDTVWLVNPSRLRTQIVDLKHDAVERAHELLPRDERWLNPKDGNLTTLIQKLEQAVDYTFQYRLEAVLTQEDEDFSRIPWRVIGFKTDRLREGRRWPEGDAAEGLRLAIIEVRDEEIVAIPAALLGKRLNELQILTALEQYGYSKEEFVLLVERLKRASRDEYIQLALQEVTSADIAPPGTLENKPVNDTVELAD